MSAPILDLRAIAGRHKPEYDQEINVSMLTGTPEERRAKTEAALRAWEASRKEALRRFTNMLIYGTTHPE